MCVNAAARCLLLSMCLVLWGSVAVPAEPEWGGLPASLRAVLENTRPLTTARGARLPLYVLPISGTLRGVDGTRTEEVLKALDRRGMAYSVEWSPGDNGSLAEGIRIASLQKKLGLGINVNATGCLAAFFNGDPETAHLDSTRKPFFDLSFDPGVKIGCAFSVEQRYPVIREQVEIFLREYEKQKLPISFIFADWEIDGPIEWNGAWGAAKRCWRCRERIPEIEDFRSFQRELRQIRAKMQRVCFAEPVTRRFPKAMVGNYGVYPDDGYRYWYDYFEKVPGAGVPVKTDQKARYREWCPEFSPTGYTCGIPVVYTWYPIFDWYEFADADYRWFYNMLLVGSTIEPNNPKRVPLISFVHWHTTAPPEKPDVRVKQFSAERYQELLRHLLLRGHSTLFLWCMQGEVAEEIKLVHEVYAETQPYAELLQKGRPVCFEVPGFDVPLGTGTVVSAVRDGDQVLVRRTDFGENRQPVLLELAGKKISIEALPGRWQVLKLK